jgi:hypothetical protein
MGDGGASRKRWDYFSFATSDGGRSFFCNLRQGVTRASGHIVTLQFLLEKFKSKVLLYLFVHKMQTRDATCES